MVQENRERYYSLDSLKAVCALLVIFIHCKYPYREAVLPITDVAVPLFFAISGYCLYGAKRNWKRIDRIGLIFAWTFILYLTKTEIFHLMTTHQWFMPSVDSIMNLLLFNDVVFAIHLWYLPAYLYVLVIAYFIDKYNLWKAAFCLIIPLLLIGGYIKYSIADTCPENIFYYRNTYFNGLPFFLLGALVKCINTVKVKNVILLIWGVISWYLDI